jgi:transcriptional pleiotropic regulator of transition state genes
LTPQQKLWYCRKRKAGRKEGGTAVKSTGIVRKVDELGRIVLPIEMRRTLDIGEKDALEIYVEGSSVILKKYKPSCIFCDGTKDISVFKGKNVCPKCLKELRSL